MTFRAGPCLVSLLLFFSVAGVCNLWTGVVAWGEDGHFLICSIAQGMFSNAANSAVQELLPDYADGNLSSLCSWADHVKEKYRWSGPLHYIDTPDDLCSYNYDRDCHNSEGEQNMCAAGALYNYSSQLTTYNNNPIYNLTQALLFFAHIVGDIHQPLHVGFTSDKGGNTIDVYWYNSQDNLHHVWDDDIIETAISNLYNGDIQAFSQDIGQSLMTKNISSWDTCNGNITCPDIYAPESVKDACQWAYKDAPYGAQLGDDYFYSRLPIVKERLAQGAARLAYTLNDIFS